MKEKIIKAIEQCFDPEIPVDLWNLGLIYNISFESDSQDKIIVNIHVSWLDPLKVRKMIIVGTKFSDLYNHIKDSDIYKNLIIHKSIEAPISDVQCVHKSEYVLNVKQGSLSRADERKINLPWSKRLARRSFLAIQGTLQTSQLALGNGVACHLAGGTHHAFKDCGSGFCVFNDLAYASIALLNQKKVKKILILDLDVHQGNGNSEIFQNDKNVLTFSMHCASNYPAKKSKSDIDIELTDNMEDNEYLDILNENLKKLNQSKYDFVFYIAGVDIHHNDRLGKLKITDEGINKRDQIVIENFYLKKVPLCGVLGGGYNKSFDKLIELHSMLHKNCAKYF